MKYRKLRIAWSVWWGVLAVLLCVLWVHSYGRWLTFTGPHIAGHWTGGFSIEGRLYVGTGDASRGGYIPWVLRVYKDVQASEWSVSAEKNTVAFHISRRWEAMEIGIVDTFIDKFFFAPYWFFVMLSATVGAAPWYCWKWKFSLRTLLIALTTVAALFAVVLNTFHESQKPPDKDQMELKSGG